MGNDQYIPAATIEKLNGHHVPGTRHQAAIDIALPLIGNGMGPEAVFGILRGKFESDVSDNELAGVVNWCVEKSPAPSGYGPRSAPAPRQPLPTKPKAPTDPKKDAREKMAWWLNGSTTTADAVVSSSPHPVPAERTNMAGALFRALFATDENINIVRSFLQTEKKVNPQGGGKTQTALEWEEWISANGYPESDAGAWMRMNPVKRIGSGTDGAPTDADVTAFRFMMIESDWVPMEAQLAFYRESKLPIAAIIQSGGHSAHAWVRLDAKDAGEYAAAVVATAALLQPFGFDKSTKNPSRLTRLPGAQRVHGASGDGIQRLLYLNPNVGPLTAEGREALALRLSAPVMADKPFLPIFQRALGRYQELENNKGKLGVPTGMVEFDKITGGLKNGQMIVIAAATGGGKTTLATNIINTAAWQHSIGVALFTLEMDRDEICDLLVSLNCSIDRNVFNHGNFAHLDGNKIAAHAENFASLPLWIADDPVMTVEQIRARVLQLKAENRIGLVVVDYLQFVSGGENYKDNREQQIAGISRGLRSLAKETKLPVIALSQLNDDGKLRESRVIAHDAHVVMMVSENDKGDFIVEIQKGRSIPKGKHYMEFQRQFGRLVSKPITYQGEPSGHPNARKNRQQ